MSEYVAVRVYPPTYSKRKTVVKVLKVGKMTALMKQLEKSDWAQAAVLLQWLSQEMVRSPILVKRPQPPPKRKCRATLTTCPPPLSAK